MQINVNIISFSLVVHVHARLSMTSLQYSHNLRLRPAENLGLMRAWSWALFKEGNPVEPPPMLAGKRRCILLPFHSFICGDTHSLLHAKQPNISHVSYITLVISKPDRTTVLWKDYFSGCSPKEDLPAPTPA